MSIYLDTAYPNINVSNLKKGQTNVNTTTYIKSIPKKELKLKEAQQKINEFEQNNRLIKLGEVVVKSKIKTQEELTNKKMNARTLYDQAQNRLLLDSIPMAQSGSVLDIVNFVSGVKVSGNYPHQSVQIGGPTSFGETTPLFLLDGLPVSQSVISSMRPFNVLFIDVLKHADATMYGMNSANGVIAIYTKRAGDFYENPKRLPGVANFTIPGFSKTREFYSPNYANTEVKHKKPNYRTTLYWEPNIRVSEK